jgi:flagellar motor switch protein FliN/FliY
MNPDPAPSTPEPAAAGENAAAGADSLESLMPGSAAAPVAPKEAAATAEAAAETPVSPLEPARTTAAPVALPELGGAAAAAAGRHFGLLLDVGVEVAAVVGTRELKLENVLAIQPGSIIDLDRRAGEPIELYVNGKPIALAEIVVVDGRLGARVVETLAEPATR